jgi:predicted RNA-binding protein Jag
VHPDDVGRVIGREGRVANALRHVVKAAATKTGARVAVEIITEDTPLEVIDSEDEAATNGADANGTGGNAESS